MDHISEYYDNTTDNATSVIPPRETSVLGRAADCFAPRECNKERMITALVIAKIAIPWDGKPLGQ